MRLGIEAKLLEILAALSSVKYASAPKFAPAPMAGFSVKGVVFK